MNERNIVDAGGDVREQITDPFAGFSVLLEFPFRFDDTSLVFVSTTTEGFDVDRFAIHAVHAGLIVKGVDMTRTAIHEQEDHALRLRGEMRWLGSKRVLIGALTIRCMCLACEKTVSGEHRREWQGRKTTSCLPKEFASCASAKLFAVVLHQSILGLRWATAPVLVQLVQVGKFVRVKKD